MIGAAVLFYAATALASPYGWPNQRLPAGLRPGGPAVNSSIESSGSERTYLIALPEKYNGRDPSPVIFSFHGGGQNATDQLELDQFTNPFFNTEAVVVYPQGVGNQWQGDPGDTSNDIQFVIDIIEKLRSELNVDEGRIWASGKSDGAGFCNTLACDRVASTKIAAFAPVSGAYYVDVSSCDPETVFLPCNPGRKHIPLLEFHGENDTVIHYNGGIRKQECLPAIPHWIQDWAEREGFSPRNISSPFYSESIKYEFGFGLDLGLITQITTPSNGHTWPATVPNADNIKSGQHLADFNATSVILDFFQRHCL